MASTTASTPERKWFFALLDVRALVEFACDSAEGALKSSPRTFGSLVSEENSDFVDLLPFAIESKERANLEKAGGDIDLLEKLAPVVEIPKRLPVLCAIVDNEKLATDLMA
ncbi:hypothetical protein [Tsuneonella sp. HG222]